MSADIEACCEIIAGPECEPFLRFMRHAYFHEHDAAWAVGEPVVRRARELGLVSVSGRRVTLVGHGYLLGNVAKEYCNYLELGRQVSALRPPLTFFSDKDVLDLGCAFGRWLWLFQRHARSAIGIEMQAEYIEIGRALAQREGEPVPRVIQGSVEHLDRHVAAGSMDFIFGRLVFNYVAIRPSFKKAVAALRAGGVIWVQVGGLRVALAQLVQSEPRLRSKALASFQLLNSLLCIATGRQATLRIAGRMHTSHRLAYPTIGWWQRLVRREGLVDFTIVSAGPEAATFFARKPAG